MAKDSTKKTLYHFHSLARVISVPAVLVLVNLLIIPLNLRLDLTAGKEYSLGEATRRAIAELKNPITIEVFFSRELPHDVIRVRQDVRDLVGEYQRLGRGRVRVEESDPSASPEAAQEAGTLGIPELPFGRTGAKKLEISAGYAGVAVRYQDQSVPAIPDVTASSNPEYDLTLAIRRLTRERLPRLGIETAHGGQLEPELRQAFAREYQVVDMSFSGGQIAPADLDGLLIIGPTEPYTPAELFALDQFVMQGGKLIALVDGVTVDEQTLMAAPNPTNLNTILTPYGLTVNADVVADPQTAEILPFPAGNGRYIGAPYPVWPRIVHTQRTAWSGLHPDHPITAKLGSVLLPWPSSLNATNADEGITLTVLGQSSPETIAFSAQNESVFLTPDALQPGPGATAGQRTVAALIQGKLASAFAGITLPEDLAVAQDQIKLSADNATVLVVGNSRFLNAGLIRSRAEENLYLVGNSLDALLQDTSLIAIRSRSISRPLQPVSDRAAGFIRYGNIFGGSVLVAVAGMLAMLARRRATRRAESRYTSTV